MNSLVLTQRQEPDQSLSLTLAGAIDEEADYSMVKPAGVTSVAFDFEKVKLINSTGLQRWIKFLESFAPTVAMAFRRCSIRTVTQINMFPGFLAGRQVTIESFFAPYFCEACDLSIELLLDYATHKAELDKLKAPKMSCSRCSKEAEFDGIEKKYFVFLKK